MRGSERPSPRPLTRSPWFAASCIALACAPTGSSGTNGQGSSGGTAGSFGGSGAGDSGGTNAGTGGASGASGASGGTSGASGAGGQSGTGGASGTGAVAGAGGSAGANGGSGGLSGTGGDIGGSGATAGLGGGGGAGGAGGVSGAGGSGGLDPEILSIIGQIDPARIRSSLTTLVGFGTRNSCSSTSSASSGVGAARDWIRQQYASFGLQVTLQPVTHPLCQGAQGNNVVAWIPGAHPTRLVVLSAHYDSLGGKQYEDLTNPTLPAPGANDSGSQTSVLLEAARVLAGKAFDATIVFLSDAGEEQGLDGSIEFATNYRSLFSGATIEVNLNMDIVGGDVSANDATSFQQFRIYAPGTPREREGNQGDPEVLGTPDDTSPARGVMRYVEFWGKAYVPTMTLLPHLREDRPGRGSDHQAFIDRKIPAVRFIEAKENFDHQHSPLDTIANMTPDYAARIGTVITASAASLARGPAAPTALEASGNAAGSVTLQWTAPALGAVDHYVLAARPVTENFYHKRFATAAGATTATVTAADLDVSGASTFFVSVAAVDAAGHESLFAYPEYRCTTASCLVQPGSLDVTSSPAERER